MLELECAENDILLFSGSKESSKVEGLDFSSSSVELDFDDSFSLEGSLSLDELLMLLVEGSFLLKPLSYVGSTTCDCEFKLPLFLTASSASDLAPCRIDDTDSQLIFFLSSCSDTSLLIAPEIRERANSPPFAPLTIISSFLPADRFFPRLV